MRLRKLLLWLIPIGFFGLVFYVPVIQVLGLGFGTHLTQSSNEVGIWPVLWFTIWQALLSTAICLLIGIPSAYIFYRRSFPGANFLRSVITVPFMLPSLIVAMVVIELGRPFGGFPPVFAIVLANVFANYAVVVRNVGSQWQTLSESYEEEAELTGAGRFRTALRISLPQLATSIRSSAAIIVLYCASSYGIVLSLGGGQVNTLETALSISVLQRLDLQHGAALALIQILFCVAAFTISRWGGANPLSFEPQTSKAKRLDRRDLPAAVLTVSITTVLVVIPLMLVLAKAFISSENTFTFANFMLLDSRGYRDLLNITFFEAAINSFRNLIVSVLISLAIGGLVSYLLAERQRKSARRKLRTDPVAVFLDGFFLMPIGVSAVVLGLGWLVTLRGEFADLRSSWVIVPLVQSLLAIPMVIRVLFPALISIDESAREQAITDGAKPFALFTQIELQIIKPVLKTAIAFSALVSLGEFGVASLLSYGDQATVPMLLHQLMSRPGNQNYQMALAVTAIMTLITIVIVLWVGRESKSIRKKQ